MSKPRLPICYAAPGPVLGKFSMMFPEEDPEKPSPPNKFQLMIALLFVSKANRFSNQMTLRLLWVGKSLLSPFPSNQGCSDKEAHFSLLTRQDKPLIPSIRIKSIIWKTIQIIPSPIIISSIKIKVYGQSFLFTQGSLNFNFDFFFKICYFQALHYYQRIL